MRGTLEARWDEGGDKVVRLAEAVPEAAYDVRPAPVERSEGETLVGFLEHAGEHYGRLAVYARLVGVVPPASRVGDAPREA